MVMVIIIIALIIVLELIWSCVSIMEINLYKYKKLYWHLEYIAIVMIIIRSNIKIVNKIIDIIIKRRRKETIINYYLHTVVIC